MDRMSAMYWADFNDGTYITVFSADTKSFKTKDVRAAYRKARKKAEAKRRKTNPQARVTKIRCVG
jgi:hypothetical protein